MSSPRYLTLLWPGLPWLWLRGSMAGLVLALREGLSPPALKRPFVSLPT